jgi:phosphoserine phosphatase
MGDEDKAKRSSNVLTSTRQAEPVQLSQAEFLDTTLALKPAVAVFDCDGTLWSGDAGYGFMIWSLDQGLVSRNASDWIDSRYRLYRSGQVSEAAMCGEMVQIYAGLHEEEIRRASAEFFRTRIEANIFPVMRSVLKCLRSLGTDIWAVSSTNNWVIEEGLKHFQIPAEKILAARVRVENDIITSDLLDVPTDEGKALALENSGIFAPDVVFGNSIHDAAMMRIAKQPFAVNPSPELVRAASTGGWPIFYPEVAPKV